MESSAVPGKSVENGAAGGGGNGLRSTVVLAVMIAGLTLLIWAGVHNARERRLETQKAQAIAASRATLVPEAAAKAGDAASGGEDAMTPKLQGKAAPGFNLVDLDGNKVSLAALKGKPVLINFWATWCGPCRLEMPWFEEFHKKYAAQGLVILGVAADDASKKLIADSVHKMGVTYPILLTDGKVTDAYGGVDFLPESFYVDRTGKVMLETAGLNGDEGGKDEIEANIKRLIGGAGA